MVLADQADRLATLDGRDGLLARDDHGRRQVSERGQEGGRGGPGVLSEDGAGSRPGVSVNRPRLCEKSSLEGRVWPGNSLHDDDGGHGLDDRHGTGQDARIMTTLGGEDTFGPVVLDGRLFLSDRRRRFETDPTGDVGSNRVKVSSRVARRTVADAHLK